MSTPLEGAGGAWLSTQRYVGGGGLAGGARSRGEGPPPHAHQAAAVRWRREAPSEVGGAPSLPARPPEFCR